MEVKTKCAHCKKGLVARYNPGQSLIWITCCFCNRESRVSTSNGASSKSLVNSPDRPR